MTEGSVSKESKNEEVVVEDRAGLEEKVVVVDDGGEDDGTEATVEVVGLFVLCLFVLRMSFVFNLSSSISVSKEKKREKLIHT